MNLAHDRRLVVYAEHDDPQLGKPLLPPALPGGRPRSVDLREVVNAILYLNREGCSSRRQVFRADRVMRASVTSTNGTSLSVSSPGRLSEYPAFQLR
jgi:hypothetical protein